MSAQLEPLRRMVGQLARLPGIGPKTAQRLAYHLLSMPLEDVREFAEAIYVGRKRIRSCARCGNWTEEALCPVCTDARRKQDQLCVVRDPRDIAAMERMGEYSGLYHVLGGTISPLEGRGPEHIRVAELLDRLDSGGVEEVILATAADVEGEATASYIAYLLKPYGVKVSRLAQGLPIGGDLEYADEVTLARAMQGRREM